MTEDMLNARPGGDMKKAILAVLAVLAMAGSAAAATTAEYAESVQVALDVVAGGNDTAVDVVEKCSSSTGGGSEGAAIRLFTVYDILSKAINNKRPGSHIVCSGSNTSGMVFGGGQEWHIATGKFVRWEMKSKQNGVNYELSADNLILRQYDSNGNYVVTKYDPVNPRNSRFIDAKLPIGVQSNGTILAAGKGLAISSNELINGLNMVYREDSTGMMSAFANRLLIEPSERESFARSMLRRR